MSERISDRTRGTSTYRQALRLALIAFLPAPFLRCSRRQTRRGDGRGPGGGLWSDSFIRWCGWPTTSRQRSATGSTTPESA